MASGSVTAKQPTLIGFMEKKKIFDINDKRALAITELIGRMIVIDLQPFSIVEDQGFIELVEHFEPRYVMPSRKYFATTVLDGLYNRCKTRLHQMIENQEFLSLTTDIWTSRARDGFISLTGHFIDSNWNRVSVVFNVREFNERHTAVNISDTMRSMINEWDLEYKVLACTRDNGANIVAALNILDILAIPCLAHTLQLIIHDGIFKVKAVQEMLAIARKIVTHYHHSVTATQCLKDMQVKLGCPEHCLIQDVDTRWNSTFYMIQRLIEQRRPISVANAELNVKFEMTQAQWKLAEKVMLILGPIEEATRECSKESASAALVIPVISAIRSKLKVGVIIMNICLSIKSLF